MKKLNKTKHLGVAFYSVDFGKGFEDKASQFIVNIKDEKELSAFFEGIRELERENLCVQITFQWGIKFLGVSRPKKKGSIK